MKRKMLLLSIILGFAIPATASMAAEDSASPEMKPEMKKEEMKAKPKKKMKKHSHMEEKTGVPVKAPDETAPGDEGTDAAKKPLHLHPRDMK